MYTARWERLGAAFNIFSVKYGRQHNDEVEIHVACPLGLSFLNLELKEVMFRARKRWLGGDKLCKNKNIKQNRKPNSATNQSAIAARVLSSPPDIRPSALLIIALHIYNLALR